MEKNVGTIDRVVRIIIGIVLVYLAATGMVQGIVMYIVGLFGLIMLATAVLLYCPLYVPLKINTTEKPK